MKKFLSLIFLALFTLCARAELIEDAPKACDSCVTWNAPLAPYKVYGNTWYVGTEGLTSVLVVTGAGLILIDGALAQSAQLIAGNIRQIGFDPMDIKYILNSHAHYDHAGGIAALQRFTGAQVLASEGSVVPLQSGEIPFADPQYNFGAEANRFPAVQNVGLVGNEESLTLGNTILTAHYTPGHTPGGTTWTWQSCEGSICLDVVYADSLSAVAADGFRFSDSDLSPNAARQISASTSFIRKLPCDILLAPHPNLIGMDEKLAARAAKSGDKPGADPFIDPDACAAYADYFDKWLARRLGEEAANSSQ